MQLLDKVVALTGAAGILGTAISHALAREGARVALLDRDGAKVTAVAQELNGLMPARAAAYTVDITARVDLENVHERIRTELGPVDVLINNAAAKSPNFFEPFESFPLEDWNLVLGINLTGAMLAAQVFGAAMAQRGGGSIINTLSVYGIVAPDQRIYEGSLYEGRAINTPAVYSASKAGLWGLTKYLAAYWGGRGVRVNAVTPGGVFSGQNETFVARYSGRVPLGRMAERTEICGAMVFLASDASSYVTGQNIVVDGGLTVW